MLYCKWIGVMCQYVDRENGDCGTTTGKCVREEEENEQ